MELICKTGESRHKEELPMDIAQLADRLTAETAKIIYGKETQIRLIVMALLSQGHVLLEDLPDTAADPSASSSSPTCCPPTSWA